MPSTQLWRQFKKNRAAAISLYFVIAFILAAIFASELSPYDPFALGDGALLAPQSVHWMGTDDLGRDTLSRVIHGTGCRSSSAFWPLPLRYCSAFLSVRRRVISAA